MKKVVIIDDETSGRSLINGYIKDYQELIVVGEANNGVDAVKIINELKPDLIFLDVEMPGLNGFQVISHLEEIPFIIFSTAYDKYALNAFEVHAVDYLLKPYTKDRFKVAISKIRWENEINNIQSFAESLLTDQKEFPDTILVNKNKKLIPLSVVQIIRIEAYGDYSKIYTKDAIYLSNYGISHIELKLNPKYFKRIHRSSIINIKEIKEIKKVAKTFEIEMQNLDIVKVSLSYLHVLKEISF